MKKNKLKDGSVPTTQLHSKEDSAYICIKPGTRQLTHQHGFLEYEEALAETTRSGGVVSNLRFVLANFGQVRLKRCKCCVFKKAKKKK
jgi:hypothetical protein